MIKIIEDAAFEDGASFYSNTANDILQKMEEAGMLPPLHHLGTFCTMDNGWESEDE